MWPMIRLLLFSTLDPCNDGVSRHPSNLYRSCRASSPLIFRRPAMDVTGDRRSTALRADDALVSAGTTAKRVQTGHQFKVRRG
jgi:hypothetical protein